MAKTIELLKGTCLYLLFSPKGAIEGLLLNAQGRTVQVSMSHNVGNLLAPKVGPGKRLRLLVSLDRSPKTAEAAHPVFELRALADSAGNALPAPNGLTSVKGVVAWIHYARHGQPNGVVLRTGEFVHLRPDGMSATGLDVGSMVDARGELRTTVLGNRMLEASRVNGYDLE